jgi:hypothetical protein
MSYIMSKPEWLKLHFRRMDSIIGNCKTTLNYTEHWDEFWEVSQLIDDIADIAWTDPDAGYQDDMLARYNAVADFMAKDDFSSIK